MKSTTFHNHLDEFPEFFVEKNTPFSAIPALGKKGSASALFNLSSLATVPPELSLLPKELSTLLSSQEKEMLTSFSHKKRFREWLGGRIAAKECLKAMELCPDGLARTVSILPDSHGRPVVHQAQPEKPFLSISHSHDFAAAIAALNPCGLDLQKIAPKISALTDKFTNTRERALLASIESTPQALTLIWTVKEAVKKRILPEQPSTFDATSLIKTKRITQTCWQVLCAVNYPPISTEVEVWAVAFEDYYFSVTVEESDA